MVDTNYSKRRTIADELHWNAFVPTAGGELVAPLIKRQGVKNADYLFRAARVVVELKVLETEFAHTPEMLSKVSALAKRYPGVHPDDPTQPLHHELLRILKAPLQRVINKANRQIKETKLELELMGFRGVIICVNDNFRAISPRLIMGLFGSILAGKSYTNAQCFIYQTNHFVEIQESPDACLLWAPTYSPRATDDLVEFVNDLGRAWRKYLEAVDGPFDSFEERSEIDWDRAHVVHGPIRSERYVGPKS